MYPSYILVTASCIIWSLHPTAVTLAFKINFNDGEYLSNKTPSTIFNPEPLIQFPGETSGDTLNNRHTSDAVVTPDGVGTDGGVLFPGYLNKNTGRVDTSRSDCIYDNMTVLYNGTYWGLLRQGFCQEGEWIVMTEKCYPECRPRPCGEGYLEYQGQCVDMETDTSSVCGIGQTLYLDQRGSTFCDCEQDHFYFPWSSSCYAPRQRGHCDFGFFLEMNGEGSVECVGNPCTSDTFEIDPTSGKCFEKDFIGYCPFDQLQYHYNNQTVGCLLIDLRNLLDSPTTHSCAPGSVQSYTDECRPEVVIRTVSSYPRSRTRGCRDGSFRVGDGPCRRINNFIG